MSENLSQLNEDNVLWTENPNELKSASSSNEIWRSKGENTNFVYQGCLQLCTRHEECRDEKNDKNTPKSES